MRNKKGKSANTKRIARNSLLLLIRMAVIMLINLYAVRLLANGLGDYDYGLFNVVAGVVLLMSSVSIVLSSAVQRFFCVALGQDDDDMSSAVFSSAINISVVFSLVALLAAETLGLWVANTQLNYLPAYTQSVNILYQCSLVSFVASLFVIPFQARILAGEDMDVYSILTALDCFAKALLAYFIDCFEGDRLVIYGMGLMIISCLTLMAHAVYCFFSYSDMRYGRAKGMKYFRKMIWFSVWTFLGALSGVGITQGTMLLLNLFFTPFINAAFAVSMQVYNAFTSFAGSLTSAIKPAMVKSYTGEEKEKAHQMYMSSNKFIFYSLMMVAVPLFIYMDVIVKMWLGSVTEARVFFCRMAIILTIVLAMHNPITIIIEATGQVKKYRIAVESITLLCLPLSYLCFKMGGDYWYSYIVMILMCAVAHVVRLIFLRKMCPEYGIMQYARGFVMPAVGISLVQVLALTVCAQLCHFSFASFFLVGVESAVVIIAMCWLFAFDKTEKQTVMSLIKRK